MYTMQDVLKHSKTAQFIAMLKGDRDFPEDAVFYPYNTKKGYFKTLAKYYKPLLKGITQKEMARIHEDYCKQRTTRLQRQSGIPEPNKRLYPLSVEQYNKFAKTVWEKRGKPRFRKQIISGVIWGWGKVETNGKPGWRRVIYSRYLGVYIDGTRLKIHCPC